MPLLDSSVTFEDTEPNLLQILPFGFSQGKNPIGHLEKRHLLGLSRTQNPGAQPDLPRHWAITPGSLVPQVLSALHALCSLPLQEVRGHPAIPVQAPPRLIHFAEFHICIPGRKRLIGPAWLMGLLLTCKWARIHIQNAKDAHTWHRYSSEWADTSLPQRPPQKLFHGSPCLQFQVQMLP